MLKITSHEGFHMTFKNGWTASVQFGPYHYCDAKDTGQDLKAPQHTNCWSSANAEIAAWSGKGPMISFGDDNVKGYVPTDEVIAFLATIAAKPPLSEHSAQ